MWSDIPYAKPPIGNLRWHAPRDFINYENTIKDIDNNSCIQKSSSEYGGVNGNENYSGSEDCLYLDIRAPKNSNKPLPVMFWIHGGGNTSGSKDLYDFSDFVRKKNIIVVSINYRLGPFGWFSNETIHNKKQGLDRTSNYGTLDIIKALEWVNKNIKYFGGDENNITIFGESAGGHNVFSLLVAKQAKGLFHKAISQSGYTTSLSYDVASKNNTDKNNVVYLNSELILNKIFQNKPYDYKDIIALDPYRFYDAYQDYDPNHEIPLLTNDGVVIPKEGLIEALKDPVNNVPIIAGSNKDEVKLWLGTSSYFIEEKNSIFGRIFGIPIIEVSNSNAFEAFNYYRSTAWQIRGVLHPLHNIFNSGNKEVYAYRFDWDDHRKWPINLKEIIGSAHGTEIPLIMGNTKIVGNLGPFIYPRGPSKYFTSKNIMNFWANFAETGTPGVSTNNIEWKKFKHNNDLNNYFIVLDKRKNLKIHEFNKNFDDLINELYSDSRLNNIEKCVVLFQLGTLIGNDIYYELKTKYKGICNKNESIDFLLKNSGTIEY